MGVFAEIRELQAGKIMIIERMETRNFLVLKGIPGFFAVKYRL